MESPSNMYKTLWQYGGCKLLESGEMEFFTYCNVKNYDKRWVRFEFLDKDEMIKLRDALDEVICRK